MKKFSSYLVLLGIALLSSIQTSFGQISVTATAGTLGPTNYSSLNAAFAAINAGTHQGSIIVEATATTIVEPSTSILYGSGQGAASYTSVLIRPAIDGVAIVGGVVPGRGLIELKGADNVTIDGDNPNTPGINRNMAIGYNPLTPNPTATFTSVIRVATVNLGGAATANNITIQNLGIGGSATNRNAAANTSTTGSENTTFGIYAGGNGGSTDVDVLTTLTSVTTNTTPAGTTINNLVVSNCSILAVARGIGFLGSGTASSTGVSFTNNTIGDQTALAGLPPYTGVTNTVYTRGIFVAGTNAVTITGNSINNILTYVNGATAGIELNSSIGTGTIAINNNNIVGVVNNSASANAPNGILISSAGGAYSVSGNTITNIQCVGNATVTGAISVGVGTGTIQKNKISTVYSRGTNTFGVYGINVTAGNNVLIQNNFIWDLNRDMSGGAAFTTTFGIFGIRIAAGTGHRIYHNSVNLSGLQTGTATTNLLSAALCIVSTTSTGMDIRNNIFANNITGGTTSIAHVSVYLPSGGTSGMNLTWNNNAYYSGTDAARQGLAQAGTTAGTNFFLATNFNAGAVTPANNFRSYSSTLSAAGSNDNSSFAFTSAVLFTSGTDLHIPAATVTVLESGGAVLSTTDDIDGQVRPGPAGSVNGGGVFPDIGADEFDGVPIDNAAPVISYTNIPNTCLTSNVTLTGVTISDLAGVPTTGPLVPRIYYKKGVGGTYFSQPGTLTSGTGQNGQWSFTIVVSDMGGVVPGDQIFYYVIAQDIATPTMHIGANPGTGLVATDVNTVTTPPTTPNSYFHSITLNGTYTVGAAGNFPTLTAAAFAYNNACLSGPVIFSLIDATYPSETYPIVFNANATASSVNNLTIKPANPGTIITGSSATALILFNGADFITINGSVSSTANTICPRVTASRDLTFTNTNTSTSSGVLSIQTTVSGDGATNNTIKNCNVVGNSNTTTLIGINVSGTAIASGAGANGNNNNTIENNSVQKTQFGIFSAGSAAVTKNLNNKINLNTITGSGANSVANTAIMVLFEDAPSIQANTIGNMVSGLSADVVAISVGINNVSNANTTGAEVSNATISLNKINKIVQTNTFSAAGINIGGSSVGTTLVSNNFIDSVFCNGTSPDFGVGIFYGGGSQINIYNNTVRINGATLTGATQPNMAVGINGTTPNVDIRNNILICSGSTGSNTNTGIGLGYTSTTGNYLNLVSNNNDIVVTGTTSAIGRTGGLAGGTARTTLANWQTETGRDLLSIITPPVFTTDLHLLAGSNPTLNNAAVSLPSITSDIDCETRNTIPDIGADEMPYSEINVLGNSVTIIDGDATPSLTDHTDFGNQAICSGTVVRTYTIQNSGTAALNISSITLTGANAADFTIGGISLPATVAISGSTTFTVTFDPSVGGVRTATVNIANDDDNENPYDYSIQGTGLDPEANVQGNSTNIPDGNTAISLSDHTDFGSTCLNGTTLQRTYTIQNTGVTTLNISSVTTTGTDASMFVISGAPTTIAASSSATFTVTFTPSSTGVKNATVNINSDDCDETIYNYDVQANVNGLPTVNFTTSPSLTVCAGNTVTLSGTGATSYMWTGGITDAVAFTPSASLTYTVTGTDGNGCTNTASAPVVVNPLPIVDLGPDQSQCSGTVMLDAGNPGASYLWSTTETTQTIVVTTTSTVIVTVTDVNTCADSDTIGIIINSSPSVALGSDITQCGGTVILDAGNPGATYVWSPNGETTQTIVANTTGTYSVVATLPGGCTASDAIDVTINPVPTASATNTGPYCAGTTIQLNSVGGSATDDWSGPSYVQNDVQNPTIVSSTVAMSGVYTVTVTNGAGCTATSTTTVVVNANPTANAANTGPYCAGATIQLNSVGGSATDDWSGPSYSQNDVQNPTIASSTVAMSGVYTVTVTNGAGCTATSTTTVVVNANPTAFAANTGAYCAGATIQLNSIGGSATDDWAGPLSYSATNVQNPTIASSTTAMSGVYTVTVTNGAGCTATSTTTVVVNANPTANATNTGPYCAGATIQLNSVGGSATDDWSGPSYTQNDTQNPTIASSTVAMSGVYTVTVTNGASCTATSTTTVVVNANPTANATNTGPYCAGATIQLNSVGGSATDDWSGPSYTQNDLQNPTIASSTVAMSGVYTVTVTNGSGCTATSTTTVVVNPTPTASATNTGPYCAGATIQLNSLGGSATDDWSGPSYTQNDVQNPTISSSTVAMSGVYTVTATNGFGCTATATTTVLVNANPTANATNNGPYCVGSTIQLNSVGGSATDDWSGPASYTATDVQNPTIASATTAMAGVYTVTVTNLAGCSGSATTTVVVNANPTASATNTGPYCAGATIQLNSVGGSATDDWSGPSSYAVTDVQNPTIASSTVAMGGDYTVTVTDVNGCTATASTTVVVNPLPTPTATNTGPYCVGATIQLNSPAGSSTDDWSGPASYSVTDVQNPTIASSTVAMSGDYTVTVTDVNGCSGTASTTVVVNPLPTPTASNTGPYCAGATIQLNASPSSSTDDWAGPLSYSVTDVQNPTIGSSTVTMSGDYTVTVTDVNGCSATATTTVTVNANPVVNLGADIIQPNPPAVLDAGAGFGSYLWSTSEVTQTISVNTNGTYIVTVTTAGCSDSDTINVNFTSGVMNINGTATTMKLYPNPTSGPFNVQIDNLETTNLTIDILDMTGRVVYTRYVGSVSGNVIEAFDMTHLRMGAYTIRMNANGTSNQLRFVIGQ